MKISGLFIFIAMTICLFSLLTTHTANARQLRKEIKNSDFIKLTNFHRPILINRREIDFSTPHSREQRLNMCSDINLTTNVNPHTFKGQEHLMTCNGWLDKCLMFDDSQRFEGFDVPKYCQSEDGRIIWADSPFNTVYGNKNSEEKCIEKILPANQTDEYGGFCNTCMCRCTEWPEGDPAKTWAFSLEPQVSNVHKNRVVVGVRFRRYDRRIYLEIKEGEINSCREGNWKSSHQQSYDLVRDIEYSPLKPDSRSMRLDKISIPSDYVVTGVKLSIARTTSVEGQNFMLHLEVQGTKFNAATGKLEPNRRAWFDSEDSAEQSYIVFKNNDLHNEDLGYYTFPYIHTSNIETKRNKPLNGIGLTFVEKADNGGFIIPEVYPR